MSADKKLAEALRAMKAAMSAIEEVALEEKKSIVTQTQRDDEVDSDAYLPDSDAKGKAYAGLHAGATGSASVNDMFRICQWLFQDTAANGGFKRLHDLQTTVRTCFDPANPNQQFPDPVTNTMQLGKVCVCNFLSDGMFGKVGQISLSFHQIVELYHVLYWQEDVQLLSPLTDGTGKARPW
jgi:hypothetical protein